MSSERSLAGLALRVDGPQQYAKRAQRILRINALQQTATKVFPAELEEPSEPPLNTAKNSAPFTGTIKSVERIVGPNATGETKHIVIDHEGKLPYWEGQSYGIIPPVRLFPQKRMCLWERNVCGHAHRRTLISVQDNRYRVCIFQVPVG